MSGRKIRSEGTAEEVEWLLAFELLCAGSGDHDLLKFDLSDRWRTTAIYFVPIKVRYGNVSKVKGNQNG